MVDTASRTGLLLCLPFNIHATLLILVDRYDAVQRHLFSSVTSSPPPGVNTAERVARPVLAHRTSVVFNPFRR